MWIVQKCNYESSYFDEGNIVKVTEEGIKCICDKCGWETGEQGIDFIYCPMCGEKHGEKC